MRLFHPEDVYRMRFVSDPQISPHGGSVAYTVSVPDPESNKTQTQIHLVPATGGQARRVTESAGSHSQPRWSPDGDSLAFVSDREGGKPQIYLMPLAGGDPVRLTGMVGGARFPQWAPDGQHLAFLSSDRSAAEPVVALDAESPLARAVAGSTRSHPAEDVRVTANINYKADGRGLFPKDPSLWVIGMDGARTPGPVPARLAEGVMPVWSPCGRYIAFVAPSASELDAFLVHDVVVWDRQHPEEVRVVYNCPGPVKMLAWAPDSGALAVVTYDRNTGPGAHFELYRLDLIAGDDGFAMAGEPALLTDGFPVSVSNEVRTDSRVTAPPLLRWAPDGWLYFVASARGCSHLFRVAAAGGGGVERVTPENNWVVAAFSLTADGVGALQIGDAGHLDEIFVVSLADGEPRRLTDENGAFHAAVTLAEPVQVTFTAADGLEIEGWLLEPHGRAATGDGGRWPMILEIHGGPHGCWGWTFHTEFQALAAQGYAVLYVNPRGSHSYNPAFTRACVGDWGGKDFGDLMAAVDMALERFPWIDPERLGVTGNSYGGFMTSWIVGMSDRFKASVAQGVVANQLSMFGTSDIGYHFSADELGAEPFSQEGIEEMVRRSPVFLAKNVTCPVLVIHAEEDHRCPIGQGEELYTALKANGKVAAFVRYPGEDHLVSSKGKPRNRVDRVFRVIDWFTAFVPPGAGAAAV